MTLGQWYHALEGLALGKYHTKFQLSSPKGMKVISCKRNADVKLHLNLQVNLNLVTNVTYARTDVTSRRNAIKTNNKKQKKKKKNTPSLSIIFMSEIVPLQLDRTCLACLYRNSRFERYIFGSTQS